MLPHAFLITPNLPEAEVLSGLPKVETVPAMERAAKASAERGVPNVLIKGGHLEGAAVDLLWSEGQIHTFESFRIATPHTHGTGCVYSAAITSCLARGNDLLSAVQSAKGFVSRAIATNPQLGHGCGPTNMWADVEITNDKLQITKEDKGRRANDK